MSQRSPLRIGIVVGEISGDILGADLVKAIQAQHPNVIIEGVAGPRMLALGCRSIVPLTQLSVMGVWEVVRHLPRIFKIRRQLINYFLQNPPDVFVGVDFPDFNLSLETKLRAHGIKTVHYNSPSVWAWRRGRLKTIAKATDLMLTLFPFEAKFYHEQHMPVQFVGHTLADQIPFETDQQAARAMLSLPTDKPLVAIMPGSRTQELNYLAESFIAAAKLCQQQIPELTFVAPMVNEDKQAQFTAILKATAPTLPIKIINGQAQQAMAAADVVLLASGTATLEAMLLKRPMVVAYRVASLTYHLVKPFVYARFMSLPNLLADQALVPELLQHEVTPENLAQAILEWFNNSEKTITLKQHFMEIHKTLKQNAGKQAAQAVLEIAGFSSLRPADKPRDVGQLRD